MCIRVYVPSHAGPAIVSQPEPKSPDIGFMDRHHFLLRRLHSLSGIVPVGVFVIMHLFTNAQMMWGQDETGESTFQHEVDFIHATPALLFVEIALWGAIAFHAGLGVLYMTGIVPNVMKYRNLDNWRYTLQRVTAWVALVFIFVHIATLRWRWSMFGWFTPFYARVDAETGWTHGGEAMALPLTAYALQYSWLVVVFYAVGVLSVVFHWANGLWTAAITWGVTISKGAQRRWGFMCAGLGVALTAFFLAAMVGALKYDLDSDMTERQQKALDKVVPTWRGDAPDSSNE